MTLCIVILSEAKNPRIGICLCLFFQCRQSKSAQPEDRAPAPTSNYQLTTVFALSPKMRGILRLIIRPLFRQVVGRVDR